MSKLTDKNRLSITHPEIAKEWHPNKNGDLKLEDVSRSSGKKVWWKCKDGHEWAAVIANRTIGGTNCPYCSGRRASDRNRFSLKFPQLLKEWDFNKNTVDPHTIPVCSTYRALWKCKNGHSWTALVYSRTQCKTGCPYCRNQK